MPIDINFLRKDKGGDPDFWRENQRKRFQDPALVDLVISLDEVRACAASERGRPGGGNTWLGFWQGHMVFLA